MSETLNIEEYKTLSKKGKKKNIYCKTKNIICSKNGHFTKMFIKPLSVNDAWKGRRFKTDIYIDYEKILLKCLPDIVIPPSPFVIYYEFGFSSASSDWDNPCKPIQDILQKRYGFNDKLIKRAIICIKQVKKGDEYFEFKLSNINDKSLSL